LGENERVIVGRELIDRIKIVQLKQK